MTLTFENNPCFTRFVSCADGARLIKISAQVARRAMDGEGLSNFSAGRNFTDDFKPAVDDKNNLTAVEFFEGKFCGAKTQTNKNRLKKRRHRRRQTHE